MTNDDDTGSTRLKSIVGISRELVVGALCVTVNVPGMKMEVIVTAWVITAKRKNARIEARIEDLNRIETVLVKFGGEVIRLTRLIG